MACRCIQCDCHCDSVIVTVSLCHVDPRPRLEEICSYIAQAEVYILLSSQSVPLMLSFWATNTLKE